MDIIISIIRGILEQGLIYGIMALGIYITYCILNFPDLSVDGTFPLGAAVTALLLSLGFNPWLALVVAFACGAAAGFITGIFHVKLQITDLLSGILTSTGLYSVNLMIVGGTALLSITKANTIFNSGPAALFSGIHFQICNSGYHFHSGNDSEIFAGLVFKDPLRNASARHRR